MFRPQLLGFTNFRKNHEDQNTGKYDKYVDDDLHNFLKKEAGNFRQPTSDIKIQ